MTKKTTKIENIANNKETINNSKHLSNLKVDSKVANEQREENESKNSTLNRLIEAFDTGVHKEQTNNTIDTGFHGNNQSTNEYSGIKKLKLHRNALEVTKLTYQPTHSNDISKNKDIKVGVVKYHKKKNKSAKKNRLAVFNPMHKSYVNYYKILMPSTEVRIESGKIRDLKQIFEKKYNQSQKEYGNTTTKNITEEQNELNKRNLKYLQQSKFYFIKNNYFNKIQFEDNISP